MKKFVKFEFSIYDGRSVSHISYTRLKPLLHGTALETVSRPTVGYRWILIAVGR